MPALALPAANGCFLWMRTRLSIRVWLPRRCDTWTKARWAAALRRDLTGGAACMRSFCCFGSAGGCDWRGLPAAHSMFCTRDAFQAVGGFDERLFGAEDAKMSWALKREGRFVVLWPSVVTSGRRMRGIRGLQILATLVGAAFFTKIFTRRSSVKKIWYDSNREESRKIPDLLITQGTNAFLLLISIVLLTDPFFDFFPQLRTIIGGPLGVVRFAANILLCHLFLVLWPCAWFLSRSLFRQTRWLERIKLVALLALCLWFAWCCTRGVIWFWPWLYQKVI